MGMNPAFITAGLPPRPDQMIDLIRRVAAIEDELDVMRAATIAAIPINVSAYQFGGSLTFPNDAAWHPYLGATYNAPVNCSRLTWFLYAQAGITWATGVPGVLALGITSSGGNGPTVASVGVAGGAQSISTFWTGTTTGVAPTDTFGVRINVEGASNAGTGNAMIQGLLVWSAN